MAAYIPRQGDFVSVTFDPQSGHEHLGRRPALVVSKDAFNRHTGFAMLCPITNTRRDYPFHVDLSHEKGVMGFVMVEQLKSLDYRARDAKRIGKASDEVLSNVLALLDACLY
jgi:mRNA interferase MazF